MSDINVRLQEERKQALKTQDKNKSRIVGLIMAALKQHVIDQQNELDDDGVIAILDKMVKERQDSIAQYSAAQRMDLVEQEQYEITVVKSFLPEQLDDTAIDAMIADALASSGAQGVREMSKVISVLRPQMVGRADMRAVSEKVKSKLENQ
jgi:uncharacterized protein YqeY